LLVPRPTFAEVRLSRLGANLRALRGLLAPGVRVLGVVKADAYGHGAIPAARALEEAGIDRLGVALVSEGAELREAGITLPILVMGTVFEEDAPDLVRYRLTPTIDDAERARSLDRRVAEFAERHSGPANGRLVCHFKVDTGMNRLGVRADDAMGLAGELRGLEHLSVEAVYTHFACAERAADPSVPEQLRRFEAALASLRAGGMAPRLVHAANSSALVGLPQSHYGMVRPGLALYGVRPCEAAEGRVELVPALELRSRVVAVKRVPKGEGVSYGHTWRAERDSVVGVLAIGYGDGYPRSLSNRGRVRVAGRLCPVVGAVCMDATMVDLTEIGNREPEVGNGGSRGRKLAPAPGPASESGIRSLLGADATLIEADNASPLSACAVAEAAGTIPYELLTGLSRRVPRVYT
jgi:alanine racemase